MKEKMTPHIIAVTAFVVFIVLGLACASSPPVVPADYVPPPKPILNLSQEIMELNDPRMPPPENLKDVQEWEQFGKTMSRIYLSGIGFSNFSVDGKSINSSYLILPPGKHKVSFTYKDSKNVSTGVRADQYETVDITAPGQLEIDMKPGKGYSIKAEINETDRSSFGRYMGGRSDAQFSVGFSVNEGNWQKVELTYDNSIKYLAPYDESVPVSSQAFLRIYLGVYIVGFDGKPVCWGWGKRDMKTWWVNIGVPAGSHTLQLVKMGDSTIYTKTVDCTSGSVYEFGLYSVGGGKVENSLPVATAKQSVAPAIFDGPTITVVNTRSNPNYDDDDVTHIFISPVTDTNWGLNRLKNGKSLRANEHSNIALQLPKSQNNRYDILIINKKGYTSRAMDVELTDGVKIMHSNVMYLLINGKQVFIGLW